MTAAFTKQYGSLLTDTMFLPTMAFYGGSAGVDQRTRNAMNLLATSFRGAAVLPDQVAISAWDPTLLVVGALRRAGLDATSVQIRDALIGSNNWVGANGAYDFRAYPQRGIGRDAVLVVRWDTARGDFVPTSRLGGLPARP
jgi:ABC-type branched-subunit amino acid transport system substrate-binding protein